MVRPLSWAFRLHPTSSEHLPLKPLQIGLTLPLVHPGKNQPFSIVIDDGDDLIEGEVHKCVLAPIQPQPYSSAPPSFLAQARTPVRSAPPPTSPSRTARPPARSAPPVPDLPIAPRYA